MIYKGVLSCSCHKTFQKHLDPSKKNNQVTCLQITRINQNEVINKITEDVMEIHLWFIDCVHKLEVVWLVQQDDLVKNNNCSELSLLTIVPVVGTLGKVQSSEALTHQR